MPVVAAAEDLKRSSRHLRGDLGGELAAGGDRFSADGAALLKFHGIYQQDDRDQRRERTRAKLDPAWQFMVRASVPGGVLGPDQWLAMDRLASEVGGGALRVTTRQGVQWHGVGKGGLRPLLSSLHRELVTTLGACGDVVRNVACCPAPLDDGRQQVLDGIARQLASRFRPRTGAWYELWVDGERAVTASRPAPEDEPVYGDAYLPRKFKIGVAWPGDNCIDVYSQDVGIVPVDGGYAVLAGGGMGMSHAREDDTFPRLATPVGWCPPELLGDVVEAIVGVHRDHGNREDRQRARLKYVLAERGEAWFRAEVESRLGRALADVPDLPPWTGADEHLGWHRQAGGGWFLGVHVDSGRVRDGVRAALAEVVDRFRPEVRLTARQDVLLCGLRASDRRPVEAVLRSHGVALAEELPPVRRLAVACPALPTCGQALADAERVLPDVVAMVDGALAEAGAAGEEVRVHVTGCPNGCARPYTAEIGIVGRTKTRYDVWVGGSAAGTRLARRLAAGVPLADVGVVLGPVLARWVAERVAGEGVGDFCARVGAGEPIRAEEALACRP